MKIVIENWVANTEMLVYTKEQKKVFQSNLSSKSYETELTD